MQIGSFNISYQKNEPLPEESAKEQPKRLGKEISFADSFEFENYNLRPYNPSELWQRNGNYDIYDLMREDDQISAALSLKKIITLNSDWVIESDNEDIVDFITWNFNEMLDDAFTKKLYEIMSALDYGFSFTEKISSVVDYQGSTKFAFTALKTRAPHSIEFQQSAQGALEQIRQTSAGKDLFFKGDELKKFIIYTYNKEFDNFYGNSELNKGVYRAWWSKEAIIKFWNMFLERHGSPTPVVKHPRSAGTQEKNIVKKILRNWQSKTGIMFPDDFEIELLTASSGDASGGYESAIDKYNTMITRRMLIPDLIGLSGGQTKGGSFALGKEQVDMFMTTIQYNRQDIERLINSHLVSPLVLWNFGSKFEAKFKFQPIDSDKEQQNLKLWLDAVKTGKVPTTDESINWFLNQVEAPEVSEEELAEIKAEKEAFKEGMINNGNDDNNEAGENPKPVAKPGKGNDKGTDKPEPPKQDKKFQQTEYGFTGFRELTSYEKKTNFQQINKAFDDLEETYIKELSEAFKLVVNGLANDILTKNIIGKRRIEKVNKLRLRNMAKVERVLNAMYKDSAIFGKSTVEAPKNFIISETDELSNEDIAEWFKAFTAHVSSTESAFILNKVKPTLMDAIRNGLGVTEAMRLVDNALKGYDITLGAARIETIVRTNVSTAFNEARARGYEELGDMIQGYFYSAILDGRTSDICLSLDSGKNDIIYKPNELRGILPPNHFNCRSTVVPVFAGEEVEGGVQSLPPKYNKGEGGFLTLK